MSLSVLWIEKRSKVCMKKIYGTKLPYLHSYLYTLMSIMSFDSCSNDREVFRTVP